ncbi:MAG: AI-2E family transporter [Desulfobulbaceae bacterium]|nr:AI-2E family transporter [Desulfobulbaceae bacterium]
MTHNRDTGISEIASGALLVVLLAVILKTLDFLFIPLCVSLLFCYALGIPVDFLKRLRVPGFLRIILVVFFVLAVFYLLGRLVHANVKEFQVQLPEYEIKFWEYSGLLLDRLKISPDQAREMISGFVENFREQIGLEPISNMMRTIGSSFFSFLGNMIWVLLFMVFILAERDSISQRLVKGMGQDRAEPVLDSMERINRAVQQYLGLKTLISLITGFLVWIVLLLFGVHFALLWGVLAFLCNFIPNIGSLAATIPPVAVTLFQFGSFGRALMVGLVITMVQMVIGNFVEPKLMGRGLNLSPLVVLLSLIFWGWMWGLTGMLLSVPLTAAVKIGLEQLDSTRAIAVLMSGK